MPTVAPRLAQRATVAARESHEQLLFFPASRHAHQLVFQRFHHIAFVTCAAALPASTTVRVGEIQDGQRIDACPGRCRCQGRGHEMTARTDQAR